MKYSDSLQKLSQANPNCEFLQRLVESWSIFYEIQEACGNQFWKGCGSYLFDGATQDQCDRMYLKQKAFFQAAKRATHVLEIGVQMAHSMQIMLLANPTLHITAIDIDDRYSRPAIQVLQKHFPQAQITLYKSDSRSILSSIQGSQDFFHIDGDHRAEVIRSEQGECMKKANSKEITVVFDDYSAQDFMVQSLVANTTSYRVKESQIPECDWRNAIFHMERK